jgi:hypothetical protein
MRAHNFDTHGRARPAETTVSTAVPCILLIRPPWPWAPRGMRIGSARPSSALLGAAEPVATRVISFQDEVDPDRLISGSVICPETTFCATPAAVLVQVTTPGGQCSDVWCSSCVASSDDDTSNRFRSTPVRAWSAAPAARLAPTCRLRPGASVAPAPGRTRRWYASGCLRPVRPTRVVAG